jgi:hypothetical protein
LGRIDPDDKPVDNPVAAGGYTMADESDNKSSRYVGRQNTSIFQAGCQIVLFVLVTGAVVAALSLMATLTLLIWLFELPGRVLDRVSHRTVHRR